jgi:hypothetical protein
LMCHGASPFHRHYSGAWPRDALVFRFTLLLAAADVTRVATGL